MKVMWRRLLVLIIVVAWMGAIGRSSSAYPQPNLFGCGGISRVDYRFAGSNWSTAQRDAVRAGIAEWTQSVDFDGYRLIEAGEMISGTTVLIYRTDNPDGNSASNGVALCSVQRIELNTRLTNAELTRTTSHELGHMLGLHHTGRYDSFDGRTPALSRCLSSTGMLGRAFSQDDAASLTYRTSRVSRQSVHANPGFEQGWSYWGFEGSHSKSITTGAPQSGFSHLNWTPASNDSYLYQTANMVSGSGRNIITRINLRHFHTTAVSGTVNVYLNAKRVDYGAASGCAQGTYANGADLNNPNRGPYAWVRKVSSGWAPSTSWATKSSTTGYYLPSYGGVDLRILIYSTVRPSAGGAHVGIGLDASRALG
jgi:hypothetical protein